MKVKKLARKLRQGRLLMSSAEWRDRPSLSLYLALDALSTTTGLRWKPRQRTLHVEGMEVTYETFSAQLGPYVAVFVEKVYEQCPGFESRPGDTIVDLGAHIGFYTLKEAKAVGPTGRVYAFEPNPTVFELLRRNVDHNGLEWVECLPIAATDRSGQATLWTSPRLSTTASLYQSWRTGNHGVRVPTISLDEFVKSHNIRKIDILKMDTEGAEPLIVAGGMERALPITDRIVMESHRTRHQVRELLEPLGFRMVTDTPLDNIVYFAK
jgi:FkbM family methyltransferase